MKSKKGITVQNLGAWALAFATAIIIISVLAQTLGKVKIVQQSTSPSESISNESITFTTNNTYYSPTKNPIISLTLSYFAENNTAIPTTYYTYSTTQVKIYTNSTTAGYPNITATTYYTYYSYRVATAENITAKGLEGMEDLGDWLPTIATIIAAVVIITLIVSGFKPSIGGSFEGF